MQWFVIIDCIIYIMIVIKNIYEITIKDIFDVLSTNVI